MRDRRLTTLSALLVALMLAAMPAAPTSAAGHALRREAHARPPRPTRVPQLVPRQQPLHDVHLGGGRGVRERRTSTRRPGTAPSARSGSSPASPAASRSRSRGPSRSEDKAKIVRPGRPSATSRTTSPAVRRRGRRQLQDPVLQRELPRRTRATSSPSRATRSASCTARAAARPSKFRPPLPVGGSYQVADDDENSLLIQFEYAS